MFAAWGATQRIYGGEDFEKQLCLLNLKFVSTEQYFLSCGEFYSSGHFHLFYFNSSGAAWDFQHHKQKKNQDSFLKEDPCSSIPSCFLSFAH